MTASVTSARIQNLPEPNDPSACAAEPPPIYVIAVWYSDRPMLSTTVPLTIGGKNRRIFPMNMPMKMEIKPATSCEPKIAEMPYCVPIMVRMGI